MALKQDSELADCLQTAVEKISGKPSPISWPRKVRVHDLGQAAYDKEVYECGYTISFPGIPGFTVNLYGRGDSRQMGKTTSPHVYLCKHRVTPDTDASLW